MGSEEVKEFIYDPPEAGIRNTKFILFIKYF